MDDLRQLPNIGLTLARKLQDIGIESYDDLADVGSIEAVLRIKEADRSACYNMLYAIEGAIQGQRWHKIPKEERAQLREEFDLSFKNQGGKKR
jgi:DNA transformation protein